MECNIVTGSHFFIILFLIAVSLCTGHLSKIIPSFFTIKEGSTFLTKPLFPQEREDVTALRCSEPLRYMVGGPSKVFVRFCGMGPPGYNLRLSCYSLLLSCYRWGYYTYFKITLFCNKSQSERNVFNV